MTSWGIIISSIACHLDRSEAKRRDPAQRLLQESKKISPLRSLPPSPVEMTNLRDNHSLSPLSSRAQPRDLAKRPQKVKHRFLHALRATRLVKMDNNIPGDPSTSLHSAQDNRRVRRENRKDFSTTKIKDFLRSK